jgi:MinD-like ATPase involved in chromosome partitioning or flagellar assembly
MGLANVAYALAERGNRVLMVDFDLEAPGLDTLPALERETEGPGVVEFVHEYLHTGRTPDVTAYVSRVKQLGVGGELWVMPAGRRDPGYGARLNSINWLDLYASHEGYLMLEDLKAQWQQTLAADYVLIDSRTGYTDVAGICTRQLPDAVLLFFIPNEQNLQGLTRIVTDIRSENRERTGNPGSDRPIELLFIMSNVPDLDDEHGILQRRIMRFRKELKISHGDLSIVHRYDSLRLLDQAIFTMDHRRSRLAKEYRRVMQRLVQRNPNDRSAALEYLHDVERREAMPSIAELDLRLDELLKRHALDPEVLYAIARIRLRQGRLEEASATMESAAAQGLRTPDFLLASGRLALRVDDREGAREAALKALASNDIDGLTASEAVGIVLEADPDLAASVATSEALLQMSIEDRLAIAHRVSGSSAAVGLSLALVEGIIKEMPSDSPEGDMARYMRGVRLIHFGRYNEAAQELQRFTSGVTTRAKALFHFAVATWRSQPDHVPARLFEEAWTALQPTIRDDAFESASLSQLGSLATWATGDIEAALRLIGQARDLCLRFRVPEFSLRHYMRVPPEVFVADCETMRDAYLNGDDPLATQPRVKP